VETFESRIPRKYIGTYRPKKDGLEKASGRALFLDDIIRKGKDQNLLFAKVLRCPYPHARIKQIDTTDAEKLPGVKKILTYNDPDVLAFKPTNASWTGLDTRHYESMDWPIYMDRQVLSDTGVWVGDEMGAAVAADSYDIAEKALKLLKIEWEELPFVLDPERAMQPDAPVIHPKINPKGNVFPGGGWSGEDVFMDRGDVDKAFAKADEVSEVTSKHHNAEHAVLDTRGCCVHWEGDRLICWTNFYQGDQTRMHLANMFEIPVNKVRVCIPYVGGSFGRGNTGDQPFLLLTALLAKRTGYPVKYKHTRREDFHDTRNALTWTIKMGAKKDGTITAMSFYGIVNSGAYADSTVAALKHIPGIEMGECQQAHIPNLRMEGYCVYTNIIPGSCMRGIGNAQINLGIGLAVDDMAEKLKIDPIDLAINNFGHQWESLPDKSLEACLRAGAQKIGWKKRHRPGESEGIKKRGMGFSFNMGWHAGWQEVSRGHVQLGLKLNPDLTLILEAPTAETGVGSNSCAVFACAESLDFLNLKPEDIHWISTVDTDTGYKDMVQTDSAVSFLHAELMPKAAARLKRELLAISAIYLDTSADKIDIKDAYVFFKDDPENKQLVKDVLWDNDVAPVLITISEIMPDEKTGVPFGATFADVEVDTQTGKVEIIKMVVVSDCGTVMYAPGAEGQQIGGQCMGIGETLTEEIIYDDATGIPLNFNWIDYKIPTMADFPEVEPVLLEVWKGGGEYGACGMGEGTTSCTSRAIANAIYNATGVRMDEIPFKPEKVLSALSGEVAQ
jgi:xanthine dehydrogenase molybdenum-binding subunit